MKNNRRDVMAARVLLGVVTFFVAALIFACQPPGKAEDRAAPIIPAKFGAMNPGDTWGLPRSRGQR